MELPSRPGIPNPSNQTILRPVRRREQEGEMGQLAHESAQTNKVKEGRP